MVGMDVVSTSFASMLGAPFGYDKSKTNDNKRKFNNKKKDFTKELQQRLEHAQIESRDACEIINSQIQTIIFLL